MKRIVFIFCMVLALQARSQEVQYLREINTSWNVYKEALLSKDYVKVARMSHPMVVEKSGGEVYFIDDLLFDIGMYESIGLQIKDLYPKTPSTIISTEEELMAILPYEKILFKGEQRIVENNYMLITSQDEGQSWYFFDLSKQDEESIKIYLPHYDERLSVFLK